MNLRCFEHIIEMKQCEKFWGKYNYLVNAVLNFKACHIIYCENLNF